VSLSAWKKANQNRWNELAPIHARSAFYDVEGFKAGKSSLRSIEREELTDVAGKSLLHLQCHFGQDTLSWAKLGAQVTGVDFSLEAIKLARSLNDELALAARFLCCDIYDLPTILSDRFDIVFTSYGVLHWLPNLKEWARIIARFLKPGATFYIVEIHPLAFTLGDEEDAKDLKIVYSYFHSPEPTRWESPGSYADRTAKVDSNVSYDWTHSLGDILTALISVGLQIEFVHEFPYCVCQFLPCMEQGPDGWWRLKGRETTMPFLFSLKARLAGC
jgi:SAM-dependent methyltransferase